MSRTMEQMRFAMESHMADISELFVPGVLLTVLVRHPKDDQADICVTNDDLSEVAKMLERCIERAKD